MPHAPTPWIGLAALVAMFVLPFLPDWLLEGPARSATALAGTSALPATHHGPSGTSAPMSTTRPNRPPVASCADWTGPKRRSATCPPPAD